MMKITYQIPVVRLTRRKEAFLRSLSSKYPKMIQWFLTIFEGEGLDFQGVSLNTARTVAKELCYPTRERQSRYNCKGAIRFPHSHYYDTAITEAIQKWNSFLTWKEKMRKRGRPTGKRFPQIQKYSPVLDQTMFKLDLNNGWMTLKTGRREKNVHIPIRVPNKSHYEELDESKITSIRLCRNENNQFTLHLSQEIGGGVSTAQGDQDSGVHALSIDLGERHLACEASVRITPDGQPPEKPVQRVRFYDDPQGKRQAYREHHTRRKMQSQGKSSAIPEHTWKTQNIRRERVRQITNRIAEEVRQAESEGLTSAVFLGDLHTPVPRNRGRLSRRLNDFPRGKLRDELIHRLERMGVRVREVSERGSSGKCHECGSENTLRPSQGLFICRECGLKYNADANSAWNIMGRGVRRWGNAPEILREWAESALGAVP